MRVLTQTVGHWERPVTHLSKILDSVFRGWPPCLCAYRNCPLVKETDKQTLGQNLTVQIPHAVLDLLKNQGHQWLLNSCITQYKGLLVRDPWLTWLTSDSPQNLVKTKFSHLFARRVQTSWSWLPCIDRPAFCQLTWPPNGAISTH